MRRSLTIPYKKKYRHQVSCQSSGFS